MKEEISATRSAVRADLFNWDSLFDRLFQNLKRHRVQNPSTYLTICLVGYESIETNI